MIGLNRFVYSILIAVTEKVFITFQSGLDCYAKVNLTSAALPSQVFDNINVTDSLRHYRPVLIKWSRLSAGQVWAM